MAKSADKATNEDIVIDDVAINAASELQVAVRKNTGVTLSLSECIQRSCNTVKMQIDLITKN